MAEDSRHYIGVDVGGTKLLALVVTDDGQVAASHKTPTKQDGTPLADQIAAAVEGAADQAGIAVTDVSAIGFGVPGVVDSQTGRFVTAPNLEIDDPMVAQRLRERFEVPVAIGNDVNLGTLAEVWLGAGRGAATVVGMFVGTGIGGGVVINGRLYAGPEDLAGEIGHLVLQVDGPECGCGNLGCFEALASRTALERDLRAALAQGRESQIAEVVDATDRIKSGALAKALDSGDELVTEAMRRMAHYLAQGVLTIRHLLDPDLVILGGGVVEACGDFLLPLIEAEVREDNLKGSRDGLRLVHSELGDDAVALGAANLARTVFVDAMPPARPEETPAGATIDYPIIDRLEFGSIVVDGEEWQSDIVIRANGKVRKRKKKRARKKHGTSHVVDADELGRLCKGDPRTVVIAQGFQQMIRLTDGARQWLESRGIDCDLVPNEQAAEAFAQAPAPKAMLVHVTC